MRLTAIHKLTDALLEISGIHEIGEKDGIYYLTGEYDPRTMKMTPLTVIYDGAIFFKTSKIELDDKLYYSLELFNDKGTADVNN